MSAEEVEAGPTDAHPTASERRKRRRRALLIAGVGVVASAAVVTVAALVLRSPKIAAKLEPVVASSKGAVLDGIGNLTGKSYDLGVGSSVPVEAIKDAANLAGVSSEGSMPVVAQRVAESAGLPWSTAHDSRATPSGGGSTITLPGLVTVLEALAAKVEARRAA